jgi:hypothetical protein
MMHNSVNSTTDTACPPHDRRPVSLSPPPRRAQKPNRKSFWNSVRLFLCRIDVCWTFFFFLFLVCIAATTTAITQTKISEALLENLHDAHQLHINTLFKKTDQGTDRVFSMVAGFLTLHSQEAFQYRSEATLSTLCSLLTTYDTTLDLRSLAVTSLSLQEAIACLHGDTSLSSAHQLYGWISENSVIPGLYLVNNTTYTFERPLQPVYGGWPASSYNLTGVLESLPLRTDVFQEAERYYNGTIKYVNYRKLWRAFSVIPHILYCSIPAGFLFRGLRLPTGMAITDYVDVRINGAGILTTRTASAWTSITATTFINASLDDDDPIVMSNNWGQQSVNDSEIMNSILGESGKLS